MLRPELNRPEPPKGARPYFKDVCIHQFKHIDTSKFKEATEGLLYKWKVVDRFYCTKCLTMKTKQSYFEVGEYR